MSLGVPTLLLNVVDALVMTNVALISDVTKGFVLRAQAIATATTTLIAVAVCRIPTVCGIPIHCSKTANLKSNVISLSDLQHCLFLALLLLHQHLLLQLLV